MNIRLVASLLCLAVAPAAQATMVSIDLSTASSGAIVDAVGASFAQTFLGQSVVDDIGLSGSPIGPLRLQATTNIRVEFFSPVDWAQGYSLLSPPINQGPLAVLLDNYASRFTFDMGFADAGSSIRYALFGSTGRLVGGGQIMMRENYATYSIDNSLAFRGISFFDNNDLRGVRFMHMRYTEALADPVPEPTVWAMLVAGFGLAGAAQRRRMTTLRA